MFSTSFSVFILFFLFFPLLLQTPFRFGDNRLFHLLTHPPPPPPSPSTALSTSVLIDHFMTELVVNSSIVPEFLGCTVTQQNSKHVHGLHACNAAVNYAGPSPDEKALLSFAKDEQYCKPMIVCLHLSFCCVCKAFPPFAFVLLGFSPVVFLLFFSLLVLSCYSDFHYRCKDSPSFHNITLKDAQTIYLNIRGEEYLFDVLFPIDYTSKRARMSVVVRDPRDNKLRVYIKGSDLQISQRLTSTSKEQDWPICEQHLKVRAGTREQGRLCVCLLCTCVRLQMLISLD